MNKLVSLLLALALIFTLCACGGAKETPKAEEATPAPAAAPAEEAAPAGVKKLVMGTNAAFPPYEYIADDGESIVGFEVDILQHIADKLGMELEIADMEFGSVLTSVQTGKVDIGVSGLTVTEERLQNVNFTTSYTTARQSIIVTDDSPIKSVDDLFAEGADYMIGVQESTTGHIYCEDDFGADRVIAYSIGANAIEALKAGKVDCVIIDNEPAKAFVEANEGLQILESSYAEEDYAFPLPKTNPALTEAINNALKELIADGTVKTIITKYIPVE